MREAWEEAREAADEGDSILLLEEVDCLGAGAAARRVGGQLQTLLGESKSNLLGQLRRIRRSSRKSKRLQTAMPLYEQAKRAGKRPGCG